jgi:hypothetical protein
MTNSIINIGEHAFESCANLATLDLINFTGTLEKDAFYDTALTSVYSSSEPNFIFNDDGFDDVGANPMFYTPNGQADSNAQ